MLLTEIENGIDEINLISIPANVVGPVVVADMQIEAHVQVNSGNVRRDSSVHTERIVMISIGVHFEAAVGACNLYGIQPALFGAHSARM